MRSPTRIVCLLGLLTVATSAVAAGSGGVAPFRNTLNLAFNSRCNGPQGAIVVEQQTSMFQTASVGYAVSTVHSPASLRTAVAALKQMKRMGLASREARLRFPRTVVHTNGGRLVQPDLMRTAQTGGLGAATNDLSFVFEGWSSGDEAALRSYLAEAMPKARLIYGPPAFDLTVKVIQDDTLEAIQGGTYDATTNEIRVPPLSGNFPEDTYVLLMLVLNAFHDDAMLFYDAWEQGMIGAAAYAIQTRAGVSPGYDPVDPGPFYALSVYECQNLPELGNSTFYPASGATNMLVWRIAMARAAWLKCWIEDPGFFAKFNQRYYESFVSSLPGDVPSLKEIAAQAVPTVEGSPFAEWYERQYVLDTSVHTGAKLFTWNIPLTEAVGLICELYETLADGDEDPFGGQASTIYWDDEFSIELYAEEGNRVDIPSGGSTPGEGFLLPTFYNIGGPQRVTVQVDVAGLRRYYPFAYGVRGFEASENNLYGAMLGDNTGVLDVDGGTATLADVEVGGGVWGGRLTKGDLSPRQATVTFTAQSGDAVTRRFNIGWDSYCCFMNAGSQATQTHTLAYGLSGLHLMSLPLLPLNPDAAAVLGVPAEQLLMAWWDPQLAGENKYRIWPSFAFQSPGRGYWLRVPADTTISLDGIEPDPTRPYELPVAAGWNLIGSPRLSDVPLADIQVQVGDDAAVSWSEAVNSRLVQTSLYAYDQVAGYELADVLQPWAGYWMRCLEPTGVTLLVPTATEMAARRSSAVRTQAATPSRLAWKLPLLVTAGDFRSESAFLGAAAQARTGLDPLDAAAPPGVDHYAQVRFVHRDWGPDSGEYMSDVRSASTAERWDIEVSCSLPRTVVTLAWPRAADLPKTVSPVLLDPATGQRLRMIPFASYSFRTGARGGQRRLVLETSATETSVTISDLLVRPSGRMATITYHLSATATVDACVRDGQGRLVRRLARASKQAAGRQVLTWNTRDHRGRAVSSGSYRVQVSAQAVDGHGAEAQRTFQVRRWTP